MKLYLNARYIYGGNKYTYYPITFVKLVAVVDSEAVPIPVWTAELREISSLGVEKWDVS